ncbi:MAG TPA: hypothetical protein ENI92_09780 [Bacteroidetes bacterium]|nr:hypothetical protein [Bacteroidota bacterium]
MKIAFAARVKAPTRELPPKLLLPIAALSELGGTVAGLTRPPLPLLGLHFAMYGEYVGSDIAGEELGYRPQPVDDALSRAVAWYRAHGYL